jgi:probable HAF family extracellular repeat protein
MNKTLSKAFLTIVFSLASLSAVAEYTFTLLDGLDGSKSYVSSINNLGQIVGGSDTDFDTGAFRATLWNNGVATDLHPQGSIGSYAASINDLGQIVGTSTYADRPHQRATLWNNGVASDIHPQGSSAYSINNSGQIVGLSHIRATLWNNGVATDLHPQGSDYSSATSINDLGQIVGTSTYTDGNQRATVWNNGVATDIHPQGSDQSLAYSINNSGQIVGASVTADGNDRSTLWNNGVATDINPQGRTNSINNSGQIVGVSGGRATLWNNGVATDLNSFLSASDLSAGWFLTQAYDINDNGWIIGDAYNTKSRVQRNFLLQSVTPVPEADTSAMLLIGLGVIGFVARRRN